jgi:hypothetical protein
MTEVATSNSFVICAGVFQNTESAVLWLELEYEALLDIAVVYIVCILDITCNEISWLTLILPLLSVYLDSA